MTSFGFNRTGFALSMLLLAPSTLGQQLIRSKKEQSLFERATEYVDKDLTLDKILSTHDECFFPRADFTTELAHASVFDDYQLPPKPYVNMGMPKVGSQTMHDFFLCGGLRSSHFFCKSLHQSEGTRRAFCGMCVEEAVKNGFPPLQHCGSYDAYMELDATRTNLDPDSLYCVFPQHEYLEQIHLEAPNATFILPFRDVRAWTESVFRWASLRNYDFMGSMDEKCTYKSVLGGVLASLRADQVPQMVAADRAARLAQFWCDHVKRVRDFVARHPSHKLIEYQLESPDTGAELGNIFGIDAQCWGHAESTRTTHITEKEKSN